MVKKRGASCPYCKDYGVIKIGKRKNKRCIKQIFFCKLCKRKFTIDDGFLKVKYEPNIVKDALELIKDGLSLAMVQEELQHNYNMTIPRKTILYWSHKYIENIGSKNNNNTVNRKEGYSK